MATRGVYRVLRRTALAALCLATPFAVCAADIGSTAPDFELPGTIGAVKLSSYRGKPVYVDFWASWCGPCRQSFPWMNDMQAKYRAQGLQIIGVNVDAKERDALDFLADTPAVFTIVFDPKGVTPRSYRVKGMPTSVLIDADGKVVFRHSGFNADDKAELENRIQAVLKGASQ
jgi:cytochrome c biogenesis protein CcmG, thiol:disulfide interchange protein DsbE